MGGAVADSPASLVTTGTGGGKSVFFSIPRRRREIDFWGRLSRFLWSFLGSNGLYRLTDTKLQLGLFSFDLLKSLPNCGIQGGISFIAVFGHRWLLLGSFGSGWNRNGRLGNGCQFLFGRRNGRRIGSERKLGLELRRGLGGRLFRLIPFETNGKFGFGARCYRLGGSSFWGWRFRRFYLWFGQFWFQRQDGGFLVSSISGKAGRLSRLGFRLE